MLNSWFVFVVFKVCVKFQTRPTGGERPCPPPLVVLVNARFHQTTYQSLASISVCEQSHGTKSPCTVRIKMYGNVILLCSSGLCSWRYWSGPFHPSRETLFPSSISFTAFPIPNVSISVPFALFFPNFPIGVIPLDTYSHHRQNERSPHPRFRECEPPDDNQLQRPADDVADLFEFLIVHYPVTCLTAHMTASSIFVCATLSSLLACPAGLSPSIAGVFPMPCRSCTKSSPRSFNSNI